MGFFMRKIQMLLIPFISQPAVFAGVYRPARRSGCEARLHRGNHPQPTSVELNLLLFVDLSRTSYLTRRRPDALQSP